MGDCVLQAQMTRMWAFEYRYMPPVIFPMKDYNIVYIAYIVHIYRICKDGTFGIVLQVSYNPMQVLYITQILYENVCSLCQILLLLRRNQLSDFDCFISALSGHQTS